MRPSPPELHSVSSLLSDHTLFNLTIPHPTLPTPTSLTTALTTLLPSLPLHGHGLHPTITHLLSLTHALPASALCPTYYGFVTGGVTPAARLADTLATLHDQNVAVHLPAQSIATAVQDRALCMLLELLCLDPAQWEGRAFTTGAAASNVLGLACGREAVVQRALGRARAGRKGGAEGGVGEMGLLEACREAGVGFVQVLSTRPHSSLGKAASVVGLGRGSVVDVGGGGDGLGFDFGKLEGMLRRAGSVSVVVVSCGEVNTGRFATHGREEVMRLREVCDRYGAWLHVDGAFGIFARALTGPEFERVASGARYLEVADSITGDAHKLLNVPYDCGFFFCKHPELTFEVFQNSNAAYLNTGPPALDAIPSPMNTGIENSSRFRGLPVYASLMAYGRDGYVEMLERQVTLARAVASYLHNHEMFEILPEELRGMPNWTEEIFMIVLFRAKDERLNEQLVSRINRSRRIYVSGTLWDDEPASRIAVANWQVDVERDMGVVKKVLEGVIEESRAEMDLNGTAEV